MTSLRAKVLGRLEDRVPGIAGQLVDELVETLCRRCGFSFEVQLADIVPQATAGARAATCGSDLSRLTDRLRVRSNLSTPLRWTSSGLGRRRALLGLPPRRYELQWPASEAGRAKVAWRPVNGWADGEETMPLAFDLHSGNGVDDALRHLTQLVQRGASGAAHR